MQLDTEETIAQLGGRGLTGALVYCGTSAIIRTASDTLKFKVNGRRGYQTFIVIKLEPSDTYTVTLTNVRAGKEQEHDKQEDVYCDEVKSVFEQMYDKHIKEKNNGFINLG